MVHLVPFDLQLVFQLLQLFCSSVQVLAPLLQFVLQSSLFAFNHLDVLDTIHVLGQSIKLLLQLLLLRLLLNQLLTKLLNFSFSLHSETRLLFKLLLNLIDFDFKLVLFFVLLLSFPQLSLQISDLLLLFV